MFAQRLAGCKAILPENIPAASDNSSTWSSISDGHISFPFDAKHIDTGSFNYFLWADLEHPHLISRFQLFSFHVAFTGSILTAILFSFAMRTAES